MQLKEKLKCHKCGKEDSVSMYVPNGEQITCSKCAKEVFNQIRNIDKFYAK